MIPQAHAVPLPWQVPSEVFGRMARQRGVFWLDSSLLREGDGRFSVMGCNPRATFTARDKTWHCEEAHGIAADRRLDPLEALEQWLKRERVLPSAAAKHLPFHGGAVGWLAYDLGRHFEHVDVRAVDDMRVPDIHLAWYDAAVVWDHGTETMWLVSVPGSRGVTAAVDELARCLREPPLDFRMKSRPGTTVARSNLSRSEYMARVAAAREGIARGEYYQLNLVQRFTCPLSEDPAATYLRLRGINPAPFSAYLAADDLAVLSSSPERFLEVTPTGRIRTCPIKGTCPRGATGTEDAARRAELLSSAKERAELLMIVDLLRNDLGRVCLPGSVTVNRLHALESFATVHHLVGEVEGQLRPDLGVPELLRAVFPGGSITGAPKVSAMRAIEHLEPHRRGIGMGALGYFSAHGRVDLNIAIRTIITQGGQAQVPVGAGIVWDSDPAAEYAETLAKARAPFAALGVGKVES